MRAFSLLFYFQQLSLFSLDIQGLKWKKNEHREWNIRTLKKGSNNENSETWGTKLNLFAPLRQQTRGIFF
jgi:hypothetical protein